ncbi:MAG: MerR family transcriptional regulator [Rickettsiales bacterium]|nr:MerR family transcriptional regulator [Rickettsiales bacterium]|tara:strand:- start:1041 stop:1505 length:465 start_codon:yes stop_codon:yes gene_type:complete
MGRESVVEIPDKVYFKIGEVARLAELKPYVLRYWESEFGVLRPKKSRSGQRMYRRSDVELVLHIKDLLKRRKFTIAGARTELSKGRRAEPGEDEAATLRRDPPVAPAQVLEVPPAPVVDAALQERLEAQDALLRHLRSELEELRAAVRHQGRLG